MASETGYSAGRVFLQVVPSYRNFMRALRQDARGPLGKAIADTFEKEMEKAGVSSGEAYAKKVKQAIDKKLDGDALTRDFTKNLTKALDEVGDSSLVLKSRISALRNDIEKTGHATDEHAVQMKQLATDLQRASKAATGSASSQRLHRAAMATSTETVNQMVKAEREHSKALRDTDRDSNAASRGLASLRDKLAGAKTDTQDGANAFRFFNFAILAAAAAGPALIPMLVGVAGALALLAPMLAGIAGGFGVAILGFAGITGAVKALGEQQDASSGSSMAYQRQLLSASRAVADARRGLADAYRNSAEGIERAIEQQRRAEQNLADAQKDAKRAQVELTEARKAAREEQQDLANQIAQNQLDERQGVIDLFNAYNTYGATMSDGGATNLEKEQADIGLKQAELNLKRIREEEKKLADEKKKSDKAGINGSDKVLRAEERLTDALNRQKEARLALGKAAKDVDRARADGARSVADAQRNLSRAQEDYNLALQGGAAAVDKVTEAMNKLSPAGQRFAKYLFSLRDEFGKIRKLAQEGLLPGVQDALERIITKYGPGFTSWVGETSTLLGDLSEEAGRALTNPVWSGFFSRMKVSSQQFIRDFGEGMGGTLTGFVGIMDVALPYSERFSTAIKDIGVSFGKWSTSEDGRKQLRGFFEYVERVGPKIKDFFIAFVKAVGNVGKALGPIGESVLFFLTDALEAISKIDPKKLTIFLGVFLSLVVALQVASGVIALLTITSAIAGSWLLIILGAVVALGAAFYFLSKSGKDGGFFGRLRKELAPAAKVLGKFVEIIKDRLVKTFKEDLMPALKSIWQSIKKDLLPAFVRFEPVLLKIGKVLSWLFGFLLGSIIEAVKNIIIGVIKIFSGLLDFLTGVFTGNWSLAWNGIKRIFSGIIQGLWGIVNLWIFGKLLGGLKALFTKALPNLFKGSGVTLKRLFTTPFKAMYDFIGNFVSKTIGALRTMKDKIGDILKKIGGFFKSKLAVPIVAIVTGVINGALIGSINRVAGWLGLGGKDKQLIKPIPTPKGYMDGGFTGAGARNQVAGVVHAGEVVFDQDAVAAAGGPTALDRFRMSLKAGRARLPGYAKGGIVWPTTTKALSGDYKGHTGVDIRAGMGSPVFAAHAGKVTATPRWNYSYGNHVKIAGTDGIQTIYGHLSKILVKVGQAVSAGKQIGNSGSTGNSSGPHLHFEVRPGGTRAAALAYLQNGKIPKGGKAGSGAGDLVGAAVKALTNPKKFLETAVQGAMKKVGSLPDGLKSMATGIPQKFFGDIFKWLKGKGKDYGIKALGKVGDFLNPFGGAGPRGARLYDQGGYLPPGMSTVFNATGRPEPVFSPEQWDKIGAGGVGGGFKQVNNFQTKDYDVNEAFRRAEQAARRARRSGNLTRKAS